MSKVLLVFLLMFCFYIFLTVDSSAKSQIMSATVAIPNKIVQIAQSSERAMQVEVK